MRRSEIENVGDHERVIKEIWDNLEFDPTTHEIYGDWVGINYFIDKFVVMMKECIRQKGFDTKYMKR